MKCFSSIKTVAALFFSLIACDSNAMKQALHPYNVDTEQQKAEIIKQQMEPVKKQADAGKAEDQYYYAKYLADLNSPDEAARYFKLAADQDHAKAQFNYGICLTNGSGVGKNLDEAAKYLKLAADQGYAKAQFCYGKCLLNGEGVNKNENEAEHYLKLAADQDHAKAQFCYGRCLLNGEGVNKNETEAEHYLKLAADQGHEKAKLLYATCLINKDKPKHYGIAAAYVQSAADQGLASAQYLYGVLALNGHGVNKDMSTVKNYWTLAAKQGHVDANLMLNYMFGQRKQ